MYIEKKEENVLDLQEENSNSTHTIHTLEEKDHNTVWELIKFAILALLIVVPIRVFIAQPFIVSGSSMYPTFEDSDYLIVDELSYKFEEPKRGDVIVFKYPIDPSKYFIKRIIALPGETIEINNNNIIITNVEHKDGYTLNEPYVKNQSSNNMKKTLGNDEYFVMGDNRSASSDSRVWGTLKKKFITGRAFLRLLPITKLSITPGEYNQ